MKESRRAYRLLSLGKRKTPNVYGKVLSIPIGRILPNPAQPRKSFSEEGLLRLAESILQFGILQPLTVRPADELPGELYSRKEIPLVYELIAGERRLRAAKMAGLIEVPCMVVAANDRRSAELAVMENLQREELSLFEEASAVASLIDIYGLSQEEVAGVLGVSPSTVAGKLRLLRLTPSERMLISRHGISERHAKALLKICDPEKRLEVLRQTIRLECSVSATEELVDRVLCPDEEKPSKEPRRRTAVLRDTRIVDNTLDRAIETIEKAGISIERERIETADYVELMIRIKKTPRRLPTARLIPARQVPLATPATLPTEETPLSAG